MKKLLIIFLVLFSMSALYSQKDISGKWSIDEIPGVKEHIVFRMEYFKPSMDRYGNSIEFLSDNKFKVEYNAPCYNDCFPDVFGKFEKSGENYIRLHVDSIYVWGLGCKNERRYPDKDIGTFFVHRVGDNIKLILSTGNLENDRMNIKYSGLLDKLDVDPTILALKKVQANDHKGILAEVLSYYPHFDLSKVNILFVDKIFLSSCVCILFEHKGINHIVVYWLFNKTAALYPGTLKLD